MTGVLRSLADLGWSVAPAVPDRHPASIDAIDAPFLGRAFGGRGVVEDIERLGGTSGTTDRRSMSVGWDESGRAAGLPDRLFVKSTPLTAKNRAMVGTLRMAVNEAAFYQQLRGELPGSVAPTCHYAWAGRGARHLLVLEDLVDRGARPYALSDECPLDHARGVVQALARLHATYVDDRRFAGEFSWVEPQTRRPGFPLLKMSFRRTRAAFLAGKGGEIDPAIRRLAELVNANDAALYARWEEGPQTVLHGDTHLGNTYQLADGTSGLLDWQVIHRGPGIREISYFLATGLPIELRRTHERELLQLYADTLVVSGAVRPDANVLWEQYRYFIFDAWDSSAITKLWPGLQAPANVEASFARTSAAVVDLEVDRAVSSALG